MARLSCWSVLAAELALGCGAKSQLTDFEPVSPGSPTSPPNLVGCTDGLEAGAAAPIAGYCSDRAGRSIHALPRSPSLVASLPTQSTFAIAPVVDQQGRAYFAIDTDDTDSAVLADTLIAVDPDGSLRASTTFEGPIGALAIVADGTLRVIDTVWDGSKVAHWVSRVSRQGEILARDRLPDGAGVDFAVSAAGSLVFTPTGNEDSGRVTATSTDGELLWQSEPLSGYAERAAISRGNSVIVSAGRAEKAEIVALDGATGAVVWRFAVAGYAGPPAIARDDSVRVPLGSPDLSSEELIALEADGTLRFRTLLPGEAVTIGEPTCIDDLGRSYVRTRDALVAVDAFGGVLFARDAHPNGTFSCAIDVNGTILAQSLGSQAIDPASGEPWWTLADGYPGPEPGTTYFAGPLVVAGDRRLVLMDYGGTVRWLGD